jgi:hypothetical protein
MPEQSYNFGTKLFGWDKQEVNNYVVKTGIDNEKKLEQIKGQIESLEKKNEELILEISNLKHDINFKMKSDDFMNFARSKFEKWMSLVNEVAQEEADQIAATAEKQEKVYDIKIEEFNNIIKNTQEELNSLLKNLLQKNENLSENLKEFIEKKESHEGDEDLILPNGINYDNLQESKLKNNPVDFKKNDTANSINIERDKRDIRSKYLFGKLVGEDILDSNNNIIIPKSTIITSEIIEKTEKEGKLSDLIINMIIPDTTF